MTLDQFYVTEYSPGYLPDSDDPALFDDYRDAVDYANELADELEDDGYITDRGWASSDNLYAIHATDPDSIGGRDRIISIERTWE
jgi:hypothetical protein